MVFNSPEDVSTFFDDVHAVVERCVTHVNQIQGLPLPPDAVIGVESDVTDPEEILRGLLSMEHTLKIIRYTEAVLKLEKSLDETKDALRLLMDSGPDGR